MGSTRARMKRNKRMDNTTRWDSKIDDLLRMIDRDEKIRKEMKRKEKKGWHGVMRWKRVKVGRSPLANNKNKNKNKNKNRNKVNKNKINKINK